jgi:hypothetical protein
LIPLYSLIESLAVQAPFLMTVRWFHIYQKLSSFILLLSVIIQALLQGVKDGMDILTLSLGGADGWTESSSSVVASRLVDQGTIVTIAAGNDGAFGSWYTSGPGNGIDVISYVLSFFSFFKCIADFCCDRVASVDK